MEMKHKQRIMGIMVLVVLLLIVIPFLFTGSKKKPAVKTRLIASLQQQKQQTTWTVQLASFSQQEHVNALVKKLQAKKFDVYVYPVGNIYRVCVGKGLTRQQAQELVTKLQQTFGLKGIIKRGV